MRADVTEEEDVIAMVARTVETFGQVDVLCNNAATPGQDLLVWEQTLENWNATLAVDITAAMLCTPRGAEAVDARARLGDHHQLLVHRRVAGPAYERATT